MKFQMSDFKADFSVWWVRYFTEKVTGCDNVPGKILRLAHNELTIHLTSLIISCMKFNLFNDDMKLAAVSSNYKKYDNLIKGNYRPVSVLTTLSKLHKSAMNV